MAAAGRGRLSPLTKGMLGLTLALVAIAAWLYLVPHGGQEEGAPGATAIGDAGSLELLAHRGGRGLWPENTLAAIEGALALGVETLELDLVMTADEVFVLHHDLRLNRDRTRGPGGVWIEEETPLFDLLADELALYDVGAPKAGSRTAERFPQQQSVEGATIPRLAAAVAFAERQSGGMVAYSLEMKRSPLEPGLAPEADYAAERLAEQLRQLGIVGRVTVQSFDWAFLAAFQQALPEVPTVYLSSEQLSFDTVRRSESVPSPWLGGADLAAAEGSLPRLVASRGGAVWSPNYRDLRPVDLEEAHRLGLRVVTWTVNDPDDMASLVEMGVDGIVTDYPDRLRATMEAKGLALPAAHPPVAD